MTDTPDGDAIEEMAKPLYKVPKLKDNGETCGNCRFFTYKWKTKAHGLMNCQEARLIDKTSPACREFEINADLKIQQLRNLKPVQSVLKKVCSPKFDIDPTLKLDIQQYFMAALYKGGKEVSFMPKEIRSKDDVLDAISVYQHIQANRDRVVAIRMGLKEIQGELGKLWDALYSVVLDRAPEIGNLRSGDMRERAVRAVIPELSDRMHELNLLISKCDDVLENLHQAYFTLHAMVDAAKFGIRELRGY